MSGVELLPTGSGGGGGGVGEGLGLGGRLRRTSVSSLLFFHLLRIRHAVLLLLLAVTAPRDGFVRVAMANCG
jgi:hypothetical protein